MGRNKDIRSESDDISGKVVITMAKKTRWGLELLRSLQVQELPHI